MNCLQDMVHKIGALGQCCEQGEHGCNPWVSKIRTFLGGVRNMEYPLGITFFSFSFFFIVLKVRTHFLNICT